MHEGVVVGCFQPGQADQGARVAHHRVGNFFNQRCRRFGLDGLAHACFLEHRDNGFLAACADFCRAFHFIVEGGFGNAFRWRGRNFLGGRRLQIVDFFARFDVQTLGQVDPDFPDLAFLDQGDVLRVSQNELCPPERMVEPGAAECLQVHAETNMFNGDFFEHIC